jgi:hypothetical protein
MLTKQMHRQICDDLSETMRLDKERKRLEIERISSPRTAEKVAIVLMIVACFAALGVLLVKYLNHA